MTKAGSSQITLTIPLLIAIFSLSFPAYAQYSGGTGEPNDPYKIATAEDLILLGETPEDYDKHFILTAEIDLDPNLPGRKVFGRAVIAPDTNDMESGFQGTSFTGGLDGNDYAITNLTISGRRYLGLFGQLGLGAMISNLGLEAVDVNGTSDDIGGLAAYNEGHITKNYCNGTVNGDDEVGGLVGNNLGYVIECYSTGSVIGDESVGGLVGYNRGSIATSYSTCTVIGYEDVGGLVSHNSGDITASYSTGTVNGHEFVGGLVGDNSGSIATSYSTCMVNGYEYVGGLLGRSYRGQIIRCFSTGLVTGVEDVGGLIGNNIADVTDSFWDMEISAWAHSDGGIGKTTAEMQTANTFLEAGWDFVGESVNGPNDIWKISEGLDYPRLSWEKYGGGRGEPNNPYLIYTAGHLNELGAERNDYNKHFKLMADIDFSGYLYERAVIAPDMIDSGLQHEGKPFTGVLDGNGHAILNLTIEGNSFLGLFGYLDGDAIVSNLSIEAADVNGVSDFVGSLAGFSYGKIIGCCCTGKVSGNDNVGGLLGSNTIGGKITNCYSTVTVNGNERVGGLAGYTKGSVTMCYSTGMVISEGQNAGGLVGERNP
ncbi:MAG: GLUG motif-containing protein, partial [Planctomycetota bacterium]